MESVTYAEVIAHKQISAADIQKDLTALKKYKADYNSRSFAGNPTLYHFQLDNLCRTRVKNKKTLFEIMDDADDKAALINKAEKLGRTGTPANRLFEAYRFNGAVVFFKATTAMYIYKKYGAKKVLDPTAGWGGRLLGAWALDIDYTGFDTNQALIPAYDGLINSLSGGNLKMNFTDSLTADFSKVDYDFVLTSPPYVNLEIYQGMTPYASNNAFYEQFLILLLNKCLEHIKPGGRVAFNISPKMYDDLLKFGYRAADEQEDLLQQKRLSKNKQDKIYIWTK